MEKSESIAKLAAALNAFQSQTVGAVKGARGHHGAYTTLADAWEAARGPLTANGLAVVQLPCQASQGSVGVVTTITHSSGEWMSEVFEMPIPKGSNAAQMTGSAISYARRYAFMAALGLPSVDDDAQGQSPKPGSKKVVENARLTEARDVLYEVGTQAELENWKANHGGRLDPADKEQLIVAYRLAEERAGKDAA